MAFGKPKRPKPPPPTPDELALRRERAAAIELDKSAKMQRIEMAVLHATRANAFATLALLHEQKRANRLAGETPTAVVPDEAEDGDDPIPAESPPGT